MSLAQPKQYRPMQYHPKQPQRFRHEFPDGRHLYIKDKFTQYKMETDWCKLAESRAMNRSNMNRSAHMNRSVMARPSPSRFNRSNYDGDTTTTYSCANPDANSVKLQSENLHHHVIHSPKRERTEVLLGSILRELSEKKSNWEKLREESKIRKIAESVAKKARVQTEQSERKRAASTKKTQLINEKMLDVFSNISKYLDREGKQLKKLKKSK